MKKIIYVLLAFISVTFLFGCEKKPEMVKVEFFDQQFKLLTSFEYDKELDYTFTNSPQEENEYASMKMVCKDLNVIVDFQYDELSKKQFLINKESVSKYDDYQEYKYNGYDGYTFSTDKDNLYSLIILGDNMDDINTSLYLRFSTIDSSIETNIKKVYDSEEFQAFLNSIKFEKK